MWIRLFVILLSFIACYCNLTAEYILFKKSDNSANFSPLPIPEQDYELLYRTVLMKYQWPMSIASDTNAQKAISFALPVSYPLEEVFIRKKLQEINPTYDLIFIPTLLYEMLAMQLIALPDEERKVKEKYRECIDVVYNQYFSFFNKNSGQILDRVIPQIIQKKDGNLLDIYAIFNTINSTPCIIALHRQVNDFLVVIPSFVKSISQLNKKELNVQKVSEALKHVASKYEQFTKKVISSKIYRSLDLQKIFLYELQMHQHNLGILYRGVEPLVTLSFFGQKIIPLEYTANVTVYQFGTVTNGDKTLSESDISFFKNYMDLLAKKSKNLLNEEEKKEFKRVQEKINVQYRYFSWLDPLRSISFGNSLMAGFFKDAGACAADYFFKNEIIGYALAINKYLYLKGDLQKLLRISPLSTLIALFCGDGEFFHSRTISFYSNLDKEGFEIEGLGGEFAGDNVAYIARQTNPLRKALDLANYIERNATVLKLTSQLGGWNFDESAQRRVLQDQHYLVAILTILNKMQDYAESKKIAPKKRKRDELHESSLKKVKQQ